MPTCRARNRASWSSLIAGKAWPATRTSPEVTRVRPAVTIISVDLPAPEGPTMLTDSPAAMLSETPRSTLIDWSLLANVTWTSPKVTSGSAMLNFILVVSALACAPAQRKAPAGEPVKIVALGDSLTAGYGLRANEAFPVQLEKALNDKGANVKIINAGVSGDTATGGASRLEWAIADNPEVVIVELGANDGLRGIDPKITYAKLDAILTTLEDKGIAVLFCGMRMPSNFNGEAFAAIYPKLASKHAKAIFYPFFLDGVAMQKGKTLADGIHPNAEGVKDIVTHILPAAQQAVALAR
jgi:acyl-CoA thioesterase-1